MMLSLHDSHTPDLCLWVGVGFMIRRLPPLSLLSKLFLPCFAGVNIVAKINNKVKKRPILMLFYAYFPYFCMSNGIKGFTSRALNIKILQYSNVKIPTTMPACSSTIRWHHHPKGRQSGHHNHYNNPIRQCFYRNISQASALTSFSWGAHSHARSACACL